MKVYGWHSLSLTFIAFNLTDLFAGEVLCHNPLLKCLLDQVLLSWTTTKLITVQTQWTLSGRGGSRYGPIWPQPLLLTAESCKFRQFWGYISPRISHSALLYRLSAPSFYKSWIRPCWCMTTVAWSSYCCITVIITLLAHTL